MKSRRQPPKTAAHGQKQWYFWQVTVQAAVIVMAVVLVYLPALHAGFVWDDEQLVTRNPLLGTFSGLVEIWSGGRTADYFPVTHTVFWIESHLFGQNAGGYHLLNILLQAVNALLVWLVLRQLGIPGAWLAGLIFGIHPVHAESVAWVSELKNLLSMFFALLAMLCFFDVEEKRVLGGTAAYVASLTFFLMALLSKTQVAVVPVIFLLCAWWREKRDPTNLAASRFAREATRTWPFFALAIALGLVTIWFQNRGIGEEQIVFGSLGRRLVNAGMAVWWYVGKLFLPARLMAVYPRWRFDSPCVWEWLPSMALVALLAVLWYQHKRWTRGVFVAITIFVVALLPVLGFFRMAYLRSGTLVADHHQYFADVSLIALFSAGIALLWARAQAGIKFATVGLTALLVGAMGTYTNSRAGVYHSEETLWQDNLSKNPDAWQAQARMGLRLFQEERYSEALPYWQRTVQLKPELSEHHNLLGLTYCRLNRFDEGIAEYREALRLQEARPSGARNMSIATIRTNLANALALSASKLSDQTSVVSEEAMRRYEEAINQYEKALELDPEQPAIHRNLGLLLARLGRNDEAIVQLRAVLRIVPNEPTARETLEMIEAQRR